MLYLMLHSTDQKAVGLFFYRNINMTGVDPVIFQRGVSNTSNSYKKERGLLFPIKYPIPKH